MRISYLELRNYRRFQEVRLQFPDGIVGIIGANGSGKTTLIEGIAWALFGNVDEAVRTSKEGVKRAGAAASDSCAAMLEFELGGTGYRLEREMAGKGMTMRASLKAGDRVVAEGDAHVKKAVEKLIGMDHKSFFTSVFARQKELNALQNVRAGERKKTVLRMLRIDGIDDVIQSVREDKRGVEENIKGAEGTLLDEDGRDREAVIRARLPGMREGLAEAETLLKAAKGAEDASLKDLEDVRAKARELKKDFEAYTSTAKDLHARRSAAAELEKTAERLRKNASEAKERLAKLPELEAAERAWAEVSGAAEALEEERRKDEKASHLKRDLAELKTASEALANDLGEADKGLSASSGLEAQKAALEGSRAESERSRTELSRELGELRGKMADRKESAAKDRAKLDEILALGKDGKCPTCERVLEDAYGLLVTKLKEGIASAEAAAKSAAERVERIQEELKGLDRKDEALRKKGARIEDEWGRRRKLEASAEGLRKQLAQTDARASAKSKELSELGALRFSKEAYEKSKAEKARLKPLHDDYVRLKGTEEQLKRIEADLAEVRERSDRLAQETETLAGMAATLEPKKVEYDKVTKLVEEKMDIFTRAKDEAHSRSVKRDSAKNAVESEEKSLAEIERVKKSIDADRARKEWLATLEDVMVSFKDHLIAKVAPTLAELTSHVFEAATGGRYARVELDESYEMQVEDDGTAYPVGRFSGGEADLANLALRLAISRTIAERTGANPINFLILDEIFGSLDPERKRSVMVALTGLSAQFRQIFLITHIEDIKDLMGSVIRVDRAEDGTSTAALVP